jgi:hypothetical protein
MEDYILFFNLKSGWSKISQEKYKIVVNFLKYNSIISAIRQAKRSFNMGESRLVCPFIPSIVFCIFLETDLKLGILHTHLLSH